MESLQELSARAEKCRGCIYVTAWNTYDQCCIFYLATGKRRQYDGEKCLSKELGKEKKRFGFDLCMGQKYI